MGEIAVFTVAYRESRARSDRQQVRIPETGSGFRTRTGGLLSFDETAHLLQQLLFLLVEPGVKFRALKLRLTLRGRHAAQVLEFLAEFLPAIGR